MIYLPFVGVVPNGGGPIGFRLIGVVVVVNRTVPCPLTSFTYKVVSFHAKW